MSYGYSSMYNHFTDTASSMVYLTELHHSIVQKFPQPCWHMWGLLFYQQAVLLAEGLHVHRCRSTHIRKMQIWDICNTVLKNWSLKEKTQIILLYVWIIFIIMYIVHFLRVKFWGLSESRQYGQSNCVMHWLDIRLTYIINLNAKQLSFEV